MGSRGRRPAGRLLWAKFGKPSARGGTAGRRVTFPDVPDVFALRAGMLDRRSLPQGSPGSEVDPGFLPRDFSHESLLSVERIDFLKPVHDPLFQARFLGIEPFLG